MYKVVYMAAAKRNLKDIADYLDNIDSRLADKILNQIMERILSIGENPFRYPRYLYNQKYRWTGIKNYMVFYKVLEDKNTIQIHRVLHGSQDIEHLIND